MTPQEIRGLKAGDWITFTPTIWSDPIDGQVVELRPNIRVEWDDGHVATVNTDQLHSSKFQPRVTHE